MVCFTWKGLRMDHFKKQRIACSFATRTVFAGVAVVCVQTSIANENSRSIASAASPNNIQSQLDTLRQQLDSAEVANKAVRLELDEAQANFNNDAWLNQERAASIALLVEDVLADSSSRLNMQGNGVMMGWSDGFHLSSADGQFTLNIGGLVQSQTMARWVGVNTVGGDAYDQWRWGFGMSRAQLNFGGTAFGSGLEYYIEMGWGRSDPYNLTNQGAFFISRMWDAWLKFRLNAEMEIKTGQFMLPFTREGLIKAPYQMAVFPTLIEYRMGLERSTAVEFDWTTKDRRFALALSNGSPALFHGPVWGYADPVPPWAALSRDTLYSVTMRHEWKLLGDWDQFSQFTSPPGSERGILVGLAGHRQNTERDSPDPVGGIPEGAFWGVTGDVTLQYDGASLFASVIYERVTDLTSSTPRINFYSLVMQGSTYITNQTELFARWEMGGPDRPTAGGDHLRLMTVGMNHYIDGQDLKVTADLGFSFGEVSGFMANTEAGWVGDTEHRDQVVFRTQLQLMF